MPQAPTDIDTSAILDQNLECCMQNIAWMLHKLLHENVARNKVASKLHRV